jgi:GxxExxY protein
MEFDQLSNQIICCAIEVHRELGPGLLESAYQACLAREILLAGIPFALQVPVNFNVTVLKHGLRRLTL